MSTQRSAEPPRDRPSVPTHGETTLAGIPQWGSDLVPAQTWWQIWPDWLAEWLLGAGAQQLGEMLAANPLLRATEEALNANPLRDVVPVNWAEIVRALRTVWLWS